MMFTAGFAIARKYLTRGLDLQEVQRIQGQNQAKMHPDQKGEYLLVNNEALLQANTGTLMEKELTIAQLVEINFFDRTLNSQVPAAGPVSMNQ